MTLHFAKMQGAGNDFIVVNNMEEHIPLSDFPDIARLLCRRKFSVGADGLLVLDAPKKGGDVAVFVFNSDGSEAEMCGNGARCVTRYGIEKGLSAGNMLRMEAAAGIVTGERTGPGEYRVRLNDPTVLEAHRTVRAAGREWDAGYTELGDPGIPHAVVVTDARPETLLEEGRALRQSDAFPRGANVSFCRLVGENAVEAATYERGVEDFTLACGTGAGAITAILTLRGLVSGKNVKIKMPGGTLSVSLRRENDRITELFLTGPARVTAWGETKLEEET